MMSDVGAALVTGAAKRIGRAIALGLAGLGYAVVLHCNRSRVEAEKLCAEIVTSGGRAAVVQADLADSAAVERVVPDAVARIGALSLLVNSASIFEADAFGSLETARWNRQFAVNLRAPIFLAQAFARQVPSEAQDPSIVNLVDQRVLNPRPDFVSYYLSKAALFTATSTLAQALAPRVRVNAIGPGPTFANSIQTEAEFEREASTTPLGRGSAASDIVQAVIYLATARCVTGEMIAVDGGQHLAWRPR